MDSDILFRTAATTLALVVWFAVCGGLLFLIHFLLTLPMRRAERARLFLDLIDSVHQQGRPLEETLISASLSGDPSLGLRFHLLAAWLERNLRLSDALAKVPRFLPPQVTAMLLAGEKIGDLRKMLPACRQLLKDALSQTRGAINYLVILTFVITPLGLFIFRAIEVLVMPKFKEIGYGSLGVAQPAPCSAAVRKGPEIPRVQAYRRIGVEPLSQVLQAARRQPIAAALGPLAHAPYGAGSRNEGGPGRVSGRARMAPGARNVR